MFITSPLCKSYIAIHLYNARAAAPPAHRTLPPAGLPLQFAEHPACIHQMIVENPAGHIEQFSDHGVSQRVAYEEAVFFRRDDVPIPEDDELLGDDRLLQSQRFLQFLNRASTADEDLKDLNPDRMGQRTKKLRFECLELTGWHEITGSPSLTVLFPARA